MNTVESAIAAVPAVTGMAAKHLDTGQELAHQADDLYFTSQHLQGCRSSSSSTARSTWGSLTPPRGWG